MASSRYPGKPLVPLRGVNGTSRTLVERSWRAARAAPGIERVIVATDDIRIADVVAGFGGEAVMTPAACRNGTERCAAALSAIGGSSLDIVVNLQGDAPLTPPNAIGAVVAALMADSQAVMATPAVRCTPPVLAHLLTDAAAGRVGGTTVVSDRLGRALYFSKHVLPYLSVSSSESAKVPAVHLHLGLYAYRPVDLARYAALPPTPLELAEGLEQLRFLEAGMPVAVVEIPPPQWSVIELNNPEDGPLIEAVLRDRGIE